MLKFDRPRLFLRIQSVRRSTWHRFRFYKEMFATVHCTCWISYRTYQTHTRSIFPDQKLRLIYRLKSAGELFKMINHSHHLQLLHLLHETESHRLSNNLPHVARITARHFDLYLLFLFRHSRRWRSLSTSIMFAEYSANFKQHKWCLDTVYFVINLVLLFVLTLPWLFLWYFRNTFTCTGI
jgi:hypothetical protein